MMAVGAVEWLCWMDMLDCSTVDKLSQAESSDFKFPRPPPRHHIYVLYPLSRVPPPVTMHPNVGTPYNTHYRFGCLPPHALISVPLPVTFECRRTTVRCSFTF